MDVKQMIGFSVFQTFLIALAILILIVAIGLVVSVVEFIRILKNERFMRAKYGEDFVGEVIKMGKTIVERLGNDDRNFEDEDYLIYTAYDYELGGLIDISGDAPAMELVIIDKRKRSASQAVFSCKFNDKGYRELFALECDDQWYSDLSNLYAICNG